MVKDKIQNQKIFKGDIVYIYQYKDRNKVQSIEDMEKITVEEVSEAGGGDVLAAGTKYNINVNGRIDEERNSGIVCYLVDGNKIKTSEGDKILNYYLEKDKVKLCLRRIKDEYRPCYMQAIFQIDKKIEIMFKPYDIICLDEENLKQLASVTKISHPRLHNGFISFFLNGKEVVTNDVEIYVNGVHYIGNDGILNVFEWACQNKNPLTDSPYKFQRIYSLKHTGYTMVKTRI